jgi:RND family efflux transporter MFP subunit
MTTLTKHDVEPKTPAAKSRRRSRSRRALAASVAVCALAGGLWAWGQASSNGEARPVAEAPRAAVPIVEVTHPRTGGIERTTAQPGSVHSFESVDLYAMISGYMKSQAVDIGSRVKKGDVLAEIAVPREEKLVQQATALLEQTRAQALQMEARLKWTEADLGTARAMTAQAKSDIARLSAIRTLAESKYDRIKRLHEQGAVEMKIVDEQLRDREAAIASEKTGALAVLTAESRAAGALAKVEEARADVVEARAAIDVAAAALATAQVDVDYAKIIAPFDGVITKRSYHPGEFIRSAVGGTQPPMLTVSRTDLMRVVVQVPDRDLTLTDAGDPAIVNIDGLEGREFRGAVSRIADSENPTTRTMRVEVDLPNPDGLLRQGMYGRVTIALEPPSTHLTLPSACILERSGTGKGVVQVVRGDKVEKLDVLLGSDNGALVEVRSGLNADDEVILRSGSPVEPGMTVAVRPAE